MKKFHVQAWLPGGGEQVTNVAADGQYQDGTYIMLYRHEGSEEDRHSRTVAVYNVAALAGIQIEELDE